MTDGLDTAEAKINNWVTAAIPGAALWVISSPEFDVQYPDSRIPPSPAGARKSAERAREYLLSTFRTGVLPPDDVYTLAGGRQLVVGYVSAVALTADEVALFRIWNDLEVDSKSGERIATVGMPVAAYGIAVAAEVLAFTGELPYAVDSYVTAANVAVKIHGEAALLALDPVLVGRVVATAGGRLRDAMMAAMAIAS